MPGSSPSPSPHSLSTKVVLLGSTGVGKTSILMRHNGQGFSTQVSPTIGASFSKSSLSFPNGNVELQIWDTAGQERFRAMAPMYYRNANAAFAVYDITSRASFEDMKSWVKGMPSRNQYPDIELEQKLISIPVVCVLGNKVDKKDFRDVERTEGEEWANSIGASFFETSAFTGHGIDRAFRCVGEELLAKEVEGLVVSLESSNGNLALEERPKHRKCC